MKISAHNLYFLGLIGLILFLNIVGKLIPFNHEPLFLVLFVYGLFIVFRNKKSPIDYRIVIWGGLLFFYWLVTVIILNMHGELGDRSYSHLNITHSFIAFFAISMAVYYLKPKIDFFWYLIGVAALASAVLFVFEVQAIGWDRFLSGVRLGSAYLHPTKMGVFANTVFIIMLGSLPWAYHKHRVFFVLWIALLVMVFLTVVFSQTRQAWVGWPEAILAWGVYYFLLFKELHKIKAFKVLVAGVGAGVVFFVLIFNSPVTDVFEKRVSQTYTSINQYLNNENFQTSIGYRFLGYEAAVNGISENFWTGIGEEKFREFQTAETAKIASVKFGMNNYSGIDYRHIHNQYLMSFLTKGVFGFLSMVLLLVFLYWFFISGLKKSSVENKPIWIAGLVFTIAETLIFIPDSPFIRSDTAAHFLVFSNLLIAFAVLTEYKSEAESKSEEGRE
ncbi:MAG: O-antigen ligase family protein [Pseudomonadota bacterium]|nr:O-antigen ligase family protein [Pseudomonadota bacterium]